MGGLRESWCFCKGVSKSERMKGAIFSGKGQAMARISNAANGIYGTGFLIHRNLLLTTHANLPSAVAAESSEICLQNGVAAILVPQRYPFLVFDDFHVLIPGIVVWKRVATEWNWYLMGFLSLSLSFYFLFLVRGWGPLWKLVTDDNVPVVG